MKKVLHILNTSEFSGAEKIAIDISRNINDDYEFIYASREGKIKKKLDIENVKYFPLSKINPIEIRHAINEIKPDIVHTHDFMAAVMSSLALTKTPLLSHIHTNPPWIKKLNRYTLLYLFACLKIKKILCVSESFSNEFVFKNIIKSKIEIALNPLDIEKIKKYSIAYDEKEYDLAFLGRLEEVKNPLRLIKIIEALKKEIPSVKAVFIGEGNLKKQCEKYVSKKGMADNIIFFGFLENPYPVLAKAKVYCMTSKWEGFGLSIAEAICLDIPIVATDVSGACNLVDDTLGKLCNTNKEFVEEIKILLQNQNYWSQKSINAGKKSSSLISIEEYMENIKRIYEEVLN